MRVSPCWVRKLSGWNCTPSSGAGPKTLGLARKAMISSSSVQAEISKFS